jgi:hypothetical protein
MSAKSYRRRVTRFIRKATGAKLVEAAQIARALVPEVLFLVSGYVDDCKLHERAPNFTTWHTSCECCGAIFYIEGPRGSFERDELVRIIRELVKR